MLRYGSTPTPTVCDESKKARNCRHGTVPNSAPSARRKNLAHDAAPVASFGAREHHQQWLKIAAAAGVRVGASASASSAVDRVNLVPSNVLKVLSLSLAVLVSGKHRLFPGDSRRYRSEQPSRGQVNLVQYYGVLVGVFHEGGVAARERAPDLPSMGVAFGFGAGAAGRKDRLGPLQATVG
mmetsp:Transcript_398/g.1014  ORF Transcript_398/g.1014 Transcript_398/m.1014 type:complete len:181 (-) Transcript_398:462-1004(-)